MLKQARLEAPVKPLGRYIMSWSGKYRWWPTTPIFLLRSGLSGLSKFMRRFLPPSGKPFQQNLPLFIHRPP